MHPVDKYPQSHPEKPSTHPERLSLKVTLTIAGTSYLRQGQQVEALHLELLPWGFSGALTLILSIEPDSTQLLTALLSPDLISVAIQVQGVLNQPTKPWTLSLKGLVTSRTLQEVPLGIHQGKTLLAQYVTLHFADPAAVLWKQHYPLKLAVDATLKEVIEAQPAPGVTLELDWPALEETRRLICLPLGMVPHPASYYDFLLWLVDSEQGCFTWNHSSSKYRLGEARLAGGKALILPDDCIESVSLAYDVPPRATPTLVSLYTGPTARKPITNADAATGIRRDILRPARTEAELDAALGPEKRRLQSLGQSVSVALTYFPGLDLAPGSLLSIDSEPWNLSPRIRKQVFRVTHLTLSLQNLDGSRPPLAGEPIHEFMVQLGLLLEPKAETRVRTPPFTPPVWPLLLEGTIEAPGATQPDEPYMVVLDDETGRAWYQVFVPSFNVRLLVPADEGIPNSHIYFPIAHLQRVVLEVYFDRLWIRHLLGWGHQLPLPLDQQGQQLRFGIGENSNTTVKQAYDASDPQFSVVRQHLADTIRIELTEGKLKLQVKEDTSRSSAQETFSVKPKQEADQALVKAKGTSGTSKASAEFASKKAELEGGMAAAQAEAQASLQEGSAALEGKVGAASAEVQSASQALTAPVGKLESAAADAEAALKKALS